MSDDDNTSEEETPRNRQFPTVGPLQAAAGSRSDPFAGIPDFVPPPPGVASGGGYTTGVVDSGATASTDQAVTGVADAEPIEVTRRRRRAPPINYRINDTIRVDTIDPRLPARQRAAEDQMAAFDRESHLIGAGFEQQAADIHGDHAASLRRQINEEEGRIAEAERAHDDTLRDLDRMNRDVMEQRINPARFYTENRGAGLGSAASVALGVLGQGLNPNLQNTAMLIIDRAIERDIQAQVTDLSNMQQGVATARNLYGDMLRTFRDEGAARQALRGMYLAEMERRIAGLSAQAHSASTVRQANRIEHMLRVERARANVAAARARRVTTYTETQVGSQRPGQTRGARATAATVQGNQAIANAAMQAEMAEQGASLPPQTEEIRPSDIRENDGNAAGAPNEGRVVSVTNEDGSRVALDGSRPVNEDGSFDVPVTPPTTGERVTPQQRRQRARDARAARAVYNDPNRSNHQSRMGPLRRVTDPTGRLVAEGFNVGSRPMDSGRGTAVTVFVPTRGPDGFIVVSADGTVRSISPGTQPEQGERLVGRRIVQTVHTRLASQTRSVDQMTGPTAIGLNLMVSPEGRGQMSETAFNEARLDYINSIRLMRTANAAMDNVNDYVASGNFLNVFEGRQRGAQGIQYLRIMGQLADSGSLGTLQEGERQAIARLTAIGSIAEDWFTTADDIAKARAALAGVQSAALQARDGNPLHRFVSLAPARMSQGL